MTRRAPYSLFLASALALLAAACGSDPADTPAGSADPTDAATSDSATDAAADAVLPEAGADASGDAGSEAATDAAIDAVADAEIDAAVEADTDAGAGDDATVMDSSAGVGTCTPADGDPGVIDPAGQCHQLVNCAADVTFQTGTGAGPTPAGGTLVDGLYALSAVTVYKMAAPPDIVVRATQLKQGDTIYTTSRSGASSQDNYSTGTVALTGIDSVLTQSCPFSGAQERQYTATSWQFLDFDISPQRTVVYEYTLVQ